MVSIGLPEKAAILIDHLGLGSRGAEYLFVDPTNKIYDKLYLNRGVKETFFTPSTPYAFLERFLKPGGMNEFGEVMSKWNKAIFIPPKQSQAFLQGGTFVFDQQQTLLAHYDESTGAHSDIDHVIAIAKASSPPSS
uniref:Uncharacterized protein n=1 Tax=Craspedostauros australis TaxID=1486917 RepID=A0A7R9ZK69_9STRA|mmetsp:Transcript_10671/g.29438  ORF Transcript_10671/g.29438 Transcript_10671/m.29438 type:complete len:136 (+) Transcript_10671:455-862(+)